MDLSSPATVLPQIKDAAINMNPFAFASTKGGKKSQSRRRQTKKSQSRRRQTKKSQSRRQQKNR